MTTVNSASRRLRTVPSAAAPEEAAAIVAAIERFIRDTAPPPGAGASALGPPDAWHAAALLEGVARDPWAATSELALASPWINT